MTNLDDTLAGLGIKGTARSVFAYLIESGVSSVAKISMGIRTPKSSIYSALEELASMGLTVEYSENRSKEYGIIDEQQFKDLINKRMSDMKFHEEALLGIMQNSYRVTKSVKPKIKFYVGPEGIRQSFRDMIWHKGCRDAYVMWPTKEMIDILTPEFSEWHSAKRLQYKVMLYIIRKYSDKKMHMDRTISKVLNSEGWKNDREVRYAPKNTEWAMSYWIYGDKCLFANSADDKFAFIIHSQEFADLMLVLWKNMWNVSTHN